MSRPINFQEMASRDPAIAALMGAIPGYDFGYTEPTPYEEQGAGFGDDYGWGFGLGSAFDPSMNIGYDDWGFGAGAPRPHPKHPMVRKPHPAHPAHPANDHSSTYNRTLLLDPNRNSTVKVERYSFSFSPSSALVLGTASSIPNFTEQPSASIKGQRILMNAPQEAFVYITQLQIANVNVMLGGVEDAYTYSPRSQGVMLDLPRLDPQNRATAAGSYSGSLPPGFTAAASFTFIISMQGPAVLAGGFGQ